MRPMSKLVEKVVKPVSIDADSAYEQIGIRSHGKGLFYKDAVSGRALGNKRVFWVEPDCLVINIVFAWEQAVARTQKSDLGKIASHRFPMYRPKPDLVDLDYLTYLFRTELGKHLLTLASPGGAGRNKTLGQAEFMRIQIPCPPVAEQRAIVDILSTWDRSIDVSRKLIENSEAQKTALLQKLLTPSHNAPITQWENVALRDLGEFFSGVTYSPSDIVADSEGLLVLRSSNVQNGLITFDDTVYVRSDIKTSTYTQVGDILICVRNGSRALIGKTAAIPPRAAGVAHGAFMSLFRPSTEPEFCRHLFLTERFEKLVSQNLGATINSINTSDMKAFSFLLPPRTQWPQIGRTLSSQDRTLELLRLQLSNLMNQRKALLQQLLTGKRRVKVDKEIAA